MDAVNADFFHLGRSLVCRACRRIWRTIGLEEKRWQNVKHARGISRERTGVYSMLMTKGVCDIFGSPDRDFVLTPLLFATK